MPLFPRPDAAPSSSLADMPERIKNVAVSLWSRTSRRMRLAGGIILFFIFTTWLSVQILPMPNISLEYNDTPAGFAPGSGASSSSPSSSSPVDPAGSPYNPTKVALLIENRPEPLLAPLTLHFISVVPPDWKFRFMGSEESVAHINRSAAIREQVKLGKLDLTYIPSNMSTAGQEMISRFLTTRWLYDTVLAPAENLLVFQTDSMLCANGRHTFEEYAEYDWCGSPWDPNGKYGGNGGLSIRRVSAMLDVLRHQQRVDGSEPEDVWLTMRLGVRPNANMANGSVSMTWSGEMHGGKPEEISENGSGRYATPLEAARNGEFVKLIDGWRDGFYEPMGYHTGAGGTTLHGPIWGTPEKREHIWKYCPEMKMTLKMDAAKYVPGTCHANWKRRETVVERDAEGVVVGLRRAEEGEGEEEE